VKLSWTLHVRGKDVVAIWRRPGRPVDRRLGGFIQQIFSAWDEPAVQVPLELGRQVVYGAIGYARELGFEPHADFGRAAGYLGAWHGQCELTFGRDGKPMYIGGPHDDGEKISSGSAPKHHGLCLRSRASLSRSDSWPGAACRQRGSVVAGGLRAWLLPVIMPVVTGCVVSASLAVAGASRAWLWMRRGVRSARSRCCCLARR
jgi:hypothetical protein